MFPTMPGRGMELSHNTVCHQREKLQKLEHAQKENRRFVVRFKRKEILENDTQYLVKHLIVINRGNCKHNLSNM